MSVLELYHTWLEKADQDPDLAAELRAIESSSAEIEDRFYRDLEFGTGGLRGVIGAGTNRMNLYTVAKATQGLADHINSRTNGGKLAVSFDSRIKSDLFARRAAEVLAGNGIRVHIYRELMPTPALSFAVRHLRCDGGVMVTASHNPSKYNGYKVYGPDGCQLGLQDSEAVLARIGRIDPFENVRSLPFDDALEKGLIRFIEPGVTEAYLTEVSKQQMNPGVCEGAGLKVIYTPLNGTGNKPVREILRRVGVRDVTVVPEQELPDGRFPTAPYPNPEIRQAFERALALAQTVKPDLLLATDPDCDRVGIAVRDRDDYRLVSGNEVGALLLHYVITQRLRHGTMPKDPLAVKTIVTTELCAAICEKYGVELVNVLTGFKFIGEQITRLEEKGQEGRYIFGFEESYGYLCGTYVRDKDAVVASMLICEMAAFYKRQGKTLPDMLDELYAEFGAYVSLQKSFTCEGVAGMQRMRGIMDALRAAPPCELAGIAVRTAEDLESGTATDLATGKTSPVPLPRSNVLSYKLADGGWAVVRPSGTEPKIKVYFDVRAADRASAQRLADAMERDMTGILGF